MYLRLGSHCFYRLSLNILHLRLQLLVKAALKWEIELLNTNQRLEERRKKQTEEEEEIIKQIMRHT
jgi:hypothetical protein